MKTHRLAAALFVAAGLLAAPVAMAEEGPSDTELWGEAYETGPNHDPLRGWNRAMFQFNDVLYTTVLRPVSKGYAAVVPEGGRVAVRNAFHNLASPVDLVSALLQGKLDTALRVVGRFAINTTLGVGGLFDVANEKFQMDPVDEDLGQTLGVWGVGDQVYLVWPFLGPSNLRDTVGLIGDSFLDPLTYCPEEYWLRTGLKVYDKENTLSLHLDDYDNMKATAADPYVALRDAYLQLRREQVKH